MGTTLELRIAAPTRAAGLAASEAVLRRMEALEAVLSTWRDDAELQRLNRAPAGTAVTLSPDLYALLDEAAAWSRCTGGAFDPAVGALIDVWDLRGAFRQPAPEALARARAATGLAHFAFAPTQRTVTRRRGDAWLDSGGFGKGAALRAAVAELAREDVTRAFLNLGGQVLALGAPDGADAWLVPVAHPSRRGEPVAHLRLRDRSASTSGQSERPNHVLDPRTGAPVPAWGSVTVVAADGATADILSTALFVMGPEEGMRWAAGRLDIGVLFLIDRNGAVDRRANGAMHRYLVKEFQRDSATMNTGV